MIDPLDPPDSHYLEAAEGWLGLGNAVEANEELERITPTKRAHPDVLRMRVLVYLQARKWDMALPVCETLVKAFPDDPFGWIHRSFALHELKRTQEAFDQVLPVADRFPKVWTIPYNLACYCAQLGRLEECKAWFKKAIAIDANIVRRAAMDDPDLKPLWDSMSGSP